MNVLTLIKVGLSGEKLSDFSVNGFFYFENILIYSVPQTTRPSIPCSQLGTNHCSLKFFCLFEKKNLF